MELPHLEAIWQKYRDAGLSVIAIEATGETEGAKQFINERNLTYHLLENQVDNEVVSGIFLDPGFPSSYLVDASGRILFYHLGFEEGDEDRFEKEIADLLAVETAEGRQSPNPDV